MSQDDPEPPRPPARRPLGVALMVLGWLHIAIAAAALVAGLCFCASLWLIPGRISNTMLAFAIPIFLFFASALFLPQLIGGIAILRGAQWGRVIILLLSGLMLFLFPIGTIIGVFGIWVLVASWNDRPAAPADYPADLPAPPPPHIAGYIAGALLGLAGLGAAVTMILGTAFRFGEVDRPPVDSDDVTSAAILLAAVLAIAALWFAWSRWKPRTAPVP